MIYFIINVLISYSKSIEQKKISYNDYTSLSLDVSGSNNRPDVHKVQKLVLIGSVYNRTNKQIAIVKNRYKEASNGKSITKNSIHRWFNQDYLKKNKKVYDFFYTLLEKKNNKDFLIAYKLFVESDKYLINFDKF